MKRARGLLGGLLLVGGLVKGQAALDVNGTSLPPAVLRQTYGRLPKGIGAVDLNICNNTPDRQTVLSSKIYQALVASHPGLQPVGRDLMLSILLRSRTADSLAIASVALSGVSGVFAGLGAVRTILPAGWTAGIASSALLGQQLINAIRPAFASADRIEQFDRRVLEQALVLDGANCAERTVFTVSNDLPSAQRADLSFHVR